MAQLTICDKCGKPHNKMKKLIFESDEYYTDPASGRRDYKEVIYDVCPLCLADFVMILKRKPMNGVFKEFFNNSLKSFILETKNN